MRILLISLNRLQFPYPVHPIGLDYVAGALTPAHVVQILDLCPLGEAEVGNAIATAVREFAPGAVGLSIRNVDNLDATDLRAFLGEMHAAVAHVRAATAAPIVLGGAGFTLFPAELMDALGADHGVVGEGERARALFDALDSGSPVEGLPGVVRRGGGTPAPQRRGNCGAPRRAPPSENPSLQFYLQRGGILGLQTQRGCAFRCIYCTYPRIEGGRPRHFEPDAVAREARQLEEAGASFLFLTDSVFNGDPGHSLAVAAAFRRVRLRIPWGAFFAPVPMPDDFYGSMARAGCTHAEFGTESLSDSMLPRLGKTFLRANVLSAHAAAQRAGLHVAHFLLLGGPDETAATVDETLEGCERLEGAALFFMCGMRVYPGTGLERLTRTAGQVTPGQSLLCPVFYEPPALPLREVAALVQHRAGGHPSWIVGAGAERAAAILTRLYQRGHKGPLWERLAAA